MAEALVLEALRTELVGCDHSGDALHVHRDIHLERASRGPLRQRRAWRAEDQGESQRERESAARCTLDGVRPTRYAAQSEYSLETLRVNSHATRIFARTHRLFHNR